MEPHRDNPNDLSRTNLSKLLRVETSFVAQDTDLRDYCPMCDDGAITVYLHPLVEDANPSLACVSCSADSVEIGTHREYPVEPSSEPTIGKRISDRKSSFILFGYKDGTPNQEAWVKTDTENTVIVAAWQ